MIGDLAFMPEETEAPDYISQLLGLRLTLDEQNRLQFYDVETNQRLLNDEEALALAETAAKDVQLQADEEKQRAAAEAQRAEEERQRAEQAEAENARLREELARLRSER